MSQLLDISDYQITAGQVLKIRKPGLFFQLMESSAPVDLEIVKAESVVGQATQVPDGFKYGPVRESNRFHGVNISSASSQTVKVCIAQELADLNRIVGDVNAKLPEATQGNYRRTQLDGSSFLATTQNTGGAGVQPGLQLYNPLGSGVVLVVVGAVVSSLNAGQVYLRRENALLAGGAVTIYNKKPSGPASSANVVSIGNPVGSPIDRRYVDVNRAVGFIENDPIVLSEEEGIAVNLGVATGSMTGMFDFYEAAA